MFSRALLRPAFLLTSLVGLTSCQTPPTPAPNAAAASAPADAPPPPAVAPSSLATLNYDGSQAALVALDREIAAAGRDSAPLSAIAENLVAVLNNPAATFAGRQAAAQRLGILLAGPLAPAVETSARATFAALLRDDNHVELARLALDPVPGRAIDTIFLEALPRATGRHRLAIIQSLGARRVTDAVPLLEPLLNDSEPQLLAVVTQALANIGGRRAVLVLGGAAHLSGADRAAAMLIAANSLPPSEASPVYRALFTREQPPQVHTVALRGLIASNRDEAPRLIAEFLGTPLWEQKEVLLEATSSLPAADIVPVLANALPSLDVPTQIAVLAALAHHGHAAAIPAVSAACSHADASVRAAAITALGALPGDAETAKLLAGKIAADSDNARLARQALARHHGPDVAATIQAGAQTGDPAQRALYIEQLALRYMTESIPTLIAMRSDSSTPVRIAAVGALGDLGSAAEQTTVLDWAISATDAAEQSRALRAFVTLTLRMPDADNRGQPLYAALDQASSPVALRLLPALPRLGGAASASAAARLALRDDAALAETATTTLARWPDRTALVPLLDLAEKAPDPARRAAAAQSVLGWLERNRESWSVELNQTVSRLLALASDDATRRRIAVILRRANDEDALALVAKLAAHPALAADARDTELTIRANLGPAPTFRASTGNSNLTNIADRRPRTFWSVPANPEHWLEIDCHQPRPVHQLTFSHGEREDDYPERFEVFVTDSLDQPGPARASGTGQRGTTVIEFPAGTAGRYVIIKQTAERKDGAWAISELFID